MKNKFTLIFISLIGLICSTTLALAKPQACDYTDTFYITPDTAPLGTHILGSVVGSGDVNIINQSPISFAIKGICGQTCQGSAQVTFGITPADSCTLLIRDGQIYQDPVVENIQCSGNLKYTGITYDGIFTYRYKLHFSK